MLRSTDDHGVHYTSLMFVCPGCALDGSTGLHMLSVNSPHHPPSWSFDGNLEAPTLSPSIMTGRDSDRQCHSFLVAGVFNFLGDCKHAYANQHVPLPDLPEWIIHS